MEHFNYVFVMFLTLIFLCCYSLGDVVATESSF